MRQGFANFGGNKGPLPCGAKIRMGKRDGFGGVVEQRHTNFFAQSGLDLLDSVTQTFYEPRQGKLSAEDQALVARRAAPKQHIELVIDEAGQGAVAGLADELAKLRFGRGNFGELLLLG